MNAYSTTPAIHPTAAIHPSAKIAADVEIGPFAVIGEDVVLHPNVRVGPHAVVEFADVGEGCKIHAGAFVGTAPQDLKYKGERTRLTLGANCIVRECATLNRGTDASRTTRIGSRCLFMAYSHVAHDCLIGDDVILANSVAVAGHCEVGEGTVIGGMVGLHQFVRVGKMAMIGAGAMVPLDIPPFTLAQGDRAKLSGLNLIGLRRRGYKTDAVSALKKAYRDIFSSSRPVADLLAEMSQNPQAEPVKELVEFLKSSPRGFCRPAAHTTSTEQE